MTFLELVQKAMRRASVREDVPTTLVGATGIVADFVDNVNDTYRTIQTTAHAESWFFRQVLDQTFAISDGQDEYSMPAGIEGINWRTVTVYEVAKQEETPVEYLDYYDWRINYDIKETEHAIPQKVTLAPDDTIFIYPVPDKDYTFRYDGVLDVDELSGDADTPIIPEKYQWTLIWGAIMRHAETHEDGTLLAKAESHYKPIYDKMVSRQAPTVRMITGHLYGERRRYGR